MREPLGDKLEGIEDEEIEKEVEALFELLNSKSKNIANDELSTITSKSNIVKSIEPSHTKQEADEKIKNNINSDNSPIQAYRAVDGQIEYTLKLDNNGNMILRTKRTRTDGSVKSMPDMAVSGNEFSAETLRKFVKNENVIITPVTNTRETDLDI